MRGDLSLTIETWDALKLCKPKKKKMPVRHLLELWTTMEWLNMIK